MNNSNEFIGEYKSTPSASSEQVTIALNAKGITFKKQNDNNYATIAISEIVGIHTYNQYNVVINFGAYPYHSLVCKDERFLMAIKENFSDYSIIANLFKNSKSTFVMLMLVLASVFIGLLLLAYFFLLPWMVNKAVENFPKEYEVKFGKVMFDQVKAAEKIDIEKSKTLNAFFDSLHFRTNYEVQILCVNKNEVNAYAMPGGYIVVYDGILNKMKSQEELAGLLAHEYSHIHLKHTLKSTFNSLGFTVFIQIIVGGIDDSVIGLIENKTDQLRQLHYSRALEQQADENGFNLLKQKNIDPKGMINLFERLKSESDHIIPAILSTHPLPNERITYIQKMILENKFVVKKHPSLDNIFNQLNNSSVNSY